MHFFMSHVVLCEKNRPLLTEGIEKRSQRLMRSMLDSTLGDAGLQVWADQTRFLSTAHGISYKKALAKGIDQYKGSL